MGRHSSVVACLVLSAFSILINITRFFEYSTQVKLVYTRGNVRICLFQTVQQEIDKHFHVKGATNISEDKNSSMVTWEWTIVKQTDLRMNPLYSKVRLLMHNQSHSWQWAFASHVFTHADSVTYPPWISIS